MQVVITPTAMSPKSAEWYSMQISKGCPDKSLKIKIAIRIDKPQNMKHAGYVYRPQMRTALYTTKRHRFYFVVVESLDSYFLQCVLINYKLPFSLYYSLSILFYTVASCSGKSRILK